MWLVTLFCSDEGSFEAIVPVLAVLESVWYEAKGLAPRLCPWRTCLSQEPYMREITALCRERASAALIKSTRLRCKVIISIPVLSAIYGL